LILSCLAWIAVVAWVLLVGLGVVRTLDPERRGWDAELPLALLSGCVALHLAVTVLDWVELPWTRTTLAIVALTLAVPGITGLRHSRIGRRHHLPGPRGAPPRATPATLLADGAAAALVLLMLWATLAWRSPFTDFVYHWGLKARRFALAGGIDWRFLAHPAVDYANPDYPHLWTELLAVPAIFAGRFDASILMLWTPLFLAALALELRYRLGRHITGTARGLATLAVLMPVTGFAIGHLQAGAADLPLLVALVVGVGSLQDNSAASAAVRVGIAAAAAAALKIEGVPLAALLIVLLLARHRAALYRRPRRLAQLWLPIASVVVPWLVSLKVHALLEPARRGPIEWQRWDEILASSWRVVTIEEWLGLPLLLGLTPLLLWRRHSRWIGIMVLSALTFYGYVFLCSRGDVTFLVLSALPRLLLHILPLTLLGLLVAAAHWDDLGSQDAPPTLDGLPAPEGE
jgi:hypothetical protein